MPNKSEKECCEKCKKYDTAKDGLCCFHPVCPCHTPKPEIGQREEGLEKRVHDFLWNKWLYHGQILSVKKEKELVDFIAQKETEVRQSLIRKVEEAASKYTPDLCSNSVEFKNDIIRIISEK